MSEKYDPPPGPPPNFRTQSQSAVDRPGQSSQADQSRQPQRTSWTIGGGPSNRGRDAPSTNPFRGGNPGAAQDARPSSINVPITQTYKKPPGSHQSPQTAPPHMGSDVEMSEDEFLPPPGPPPKSMGYEPPPGPPPGHPSEAPPPEYDPWLGPDDSLRPPPAFSNVRPQNEKSPTANADYDDAARAHAWCRENRLWRATEHPAAVVERIQAGDLRLTVPPNTTDVTQYQPGLGRSYVRTSSAIGDTIMLSDVPIYASYTQSPLATGQPHTTYFELQVLSMGDRYNQNKQVESGMAIGFVAPPYPAWRLPGWHRGSLGVHGDDGRRYVDNSYGGKDFTSAFKKGDVVGIGMTFGTPVHGGRVNIPCQVFFTRNGKQEGSWDLHEERDMDADEGDVDGLAGEYDLLAAVGVFGSVELEAVFSRGDWLFKP